MLRTISNLPLQKLALMFSTADVEVLGWRLGHLADKLQENDLAAVRVRSKRFAEVNRHMLLRRLHQIHHDHD